MTHVTSGFNCLRIAHLHVASELNAFIALPTGYGKSVCYALLSFVFNKLYSLPYPTSVVLRVMNLSMHECIRQGMSACVHVSSGIALLPPMEVADVTVRSAAKEPIATLFIDEAHCVQKW